MEVNYKMREHIFEIIKNQMKNNDPPETKQTYKRLKKMGYTDFVAKQLIGQCVAIELFNIIKFQESFSEERYLENLKNLPEQAVFEDEEDE